MWYVIRTKAKQEKKVVAQLTRAGHKLFFPQMQAVKGLKPLFPSYLFTQEDLSSPAMHRFVRYTRGVYSVLGGVSGPQVVSDEVIATLQSRTLDGSVITQELLLQKGDSVRVCQGLLKDLVGIVQSHLSAEQRVEVLFKWLSADVTARLRHVDLERVA